MLRVSCELCCSFSTGLPLSDGIMETHLLSTNLGTFFPTVQEKPREHRHVQENHGMDAIYMWHKTCLSFLLWISAIGYKTANIYDYSFPASQNFSRLKCGHNELFHKAHNST